MVQKPPNSRRFSTRVETPDGVWVYWHCNGRDELSKVRDLSTGGLFLETKIARPLNVKTSLHFLVQEGQISMDAEVRHVRRDTGMGLRFTSVSGADRSKLIALLARLRRAAPQQPN
jgi:c-di-GMP-binding flagellar brake protein YcgR